MSIGFFKYSGNHKAREDGITTVIVPFFPCHVGLSIIQFMFAGVELTEFRSIFLLSVNA